MKQVVLVLYSGMLVSINIFIDATDAPSQPLTVCAEIAVGELIDKITILQIKATRITDEKKLVNIHTELATLCATLDSLIPASDALNDLMDTLRTINLQMWDVEDAIRAKELRQEFDAKFIQLARSIYHTNDARCALKRRINELMGSHIIEEKSYALTRP